MNKLVKNARVTRWLFSLQEFVITIIDKLGDKHQYCSKNVPTPRGSPTVLYQPEVHTNVDVTVLYTQTYAMGPLFVTAELDIDHYGFSNQPSIDSDEV